MSNEITEIINMLCEKLGVAVDVLVPEMARYYIARLTFLTLIETTLAIIMAIIFAKITKWILKMDNDWYDWSDKVFLLLFSDLIPGVLLLISFLAAITDAANLVGWVASPTASAIREIANLIK